MPDGIFIAALAEGMRERFPEVEFDLFEDEREMLVPNENYELDGLYISEEKNEGLMVATGGFIHWHFYCDGSDARTDTGIEKQVDGVVSEVLDLLGSIFDDSLIMYYGETFWGSVMNSGSYDRGNRPRMRFWFGRLLQEWCWSRSLLA